MQYVYSISYYVIACSIYYMYKLIALWLQALQISSRCVWSVYINAIRHTSTAYMTFTFASCVPTASSIKTAVRFTTPELHGYSNKNTNNNNSSNTRDRWLAKCDKNSVFFFIYVLNTVRYDYTSMHTMPLHTTQSHIYIYSYCVCVYLIFIINRQRDGQRDGNGDSQKSNAHTHTHVKQLRGIVPLQIKCRQYSIGGLAV